VRHSNMRLQLDNSLKIQWSLDKIVREGTIKLGDFGLIKRLPTEELT
jgi:hypothetical protein